MDDFIVNGRRVAGNIYWCRFRENFYPLIFPWEKNGGYSYVGYVCEGCGKHYKTKEEYDKHHILFAKIGLREDRPKEFYEEQCPLDKKVLVTCAGYQGGYNLVQKLHDKGLKVFGTDINNNSAARFYCDGFTTLPSGDIENQEYLPKLYTIIDQQKIDVILPASSTDVNQLATFKWAIEEHGAKVLVGTGIEKINAIRVALDKRATFDALRGVIELPRAFWSPTGLITKPPIGKGARGIQELPPSFVMEKLTGEQIDVDVLAMDGEVLLTECKTRERAYGGTLMEGEIVERPEIVEEVKKIIKAIPIDYLSVIQFIGGKLIEINPRMAGAIMDWELPYLAIQLGLGKITKDDVRNHKVPIGRRTARFMSEYSYER